MGNWLELAAERGASKQDWLTPRRAHSLQLLRESQWPTRKTEAWKYIPVDIWARADLATAEAKNESVAPQTVDGLDSIDLLFVDGVFSADSLPRDLPPGLHLSSLADGATDMRWAEASFARVKPERHLFGLVNDVLASDGLIVDIDAGATIDRPLRIINYARSGGEAHTRLLVRLGTGSSATVIEQFNGNELSRGTGFAEYLVGEQAQLEHYRLALQTGAAMHVGGSHFDLATESRLVSNLVAFGSALSRVDVDINHRGERADASFNAIYLLDGKELFDLHSCIEHIAPQCTSDENVRGIVADNSRAVFNGRIHIHRGAQKTLAELNNRNLLLSDRAEVNTKPELEIYADDVRCAHGATVAEIDKSAMYYLQSRGITREQAQIMLNFGFINELVAAMPNNALAAWLRPQLRQRFATMEVK